MMKSTAVKPIVVVFLILAVLVGVPGLVLLRQSAPQFQAAATVRVVRDETDLEQLGKLAPQGTDTAIFLQNQIEIISSDTVLQKVVTQLDLNQVWGQRYLDGQKLKANEAIALLRARAKIFPGGDPAQLQIQAISDQDAEAVKLANAIATAFCEYRVERRQRLAQDKIQALVIPFQENEAKVRAAAALVEKARWELDPSVREQNPPPQPQAEDEALRHLRRELTRATMTYMAQSNQLALSQSLPPNELQKLMARVEQTRVGLTNAEAAVQTASRKQEALRAYWLARQELEKAEVLLAPYKASMAASQQYLGGAGDAPARLEEPATKAVSLPAHKAAAGRICLLIAGAFLVAAGVVYSKSRQPALPPA
jgi:capsular polysaccharide biosynthesis protein